MRDPETYRHANLSVQASSYNYCTPREDGLPLADYTSVEVAVITSEDGLTRPSNTLGKVARKLPFLPRTRRARKLDRLFEEGNSPVAGYVSHDDLDRLRDFLR